MQKSKKPKYRKDYNMCELIQTDCVSNTEMTGFIPTSIKDDEEYENYNQIINIFPGVNEKEI